MKPSRWRVAMALGALPRGMSLTHSAPPRAMRPAEEDKAAKLICTEIISMDDLPRELWIRFKNKEAFFAEEEKLYQMLAGSDGKQEVVIYLEEERAVKRLSRNRCVEISAELLETLRNAYGEEQIKVVDKKR